MKKKIQIVTSKFVETNTNLNCVIHDSAEVFKTYIETILTEIDNNIEVDTECFFFYVTYDGGMYAEDANPNSQIQRIYLKDGKICLETADAVNLPFENLDILEKQSVAECLAEVIEHEYELE